MCLTWKSSWTCCKFSSALVRGSLRDAACLHFFSTSLRHNVLQEEFMWVRHRQKHIGHLYILHTNVHLTCRPAGGRSRVQVLKLLLCRRLHQILSPTLHPGHKHLCSMLPGKQWRVQGRPGLESQVIQGYNVQILNDTTRFMICSVRAKSQCLFMYVML